MATSNTLRKIGQGFSGVFLGLTGSWLLVICIGGLVTLGVLSVFQLGVLLSLSCIGVGLLVAGACLLFGLSSEDANNTLEADQKRDWSFQAQDNLKNTTHEKAPFQQRSHGSRSSRETSEPDKRSSPLFNQ